MGKKGDTAEVTNGEEPILCIPNKFRRRSAKKDGESMVFQMAT